MFITASSTISFQPTYLNSGFSESITALDKASKLIAPDYSSLINAMDRRRMSDVLKMSFACSKAVLEQSGISQPEAIIVATSLGCAVHTSNFLDKIYESQDGLISPTSFIVSTHNTIAGQLSLHLKTHGYNITFTHNSLSFEQALTDAQLCLGEGLNHLLVGASEELDSTLFNLKERLGSDELLVTTGTSFFMIGSEKETSNSIEIKSVQNAALINSPRKVVDEFLKENNISISDIGLVLYGVTASPSFALLNSIFPATSMVDYFKYSGGYMSNAAFGLTLGIDILQNHSSRYQFDRSKFILIYNNIIPENLGLILVKK